MIPFFRSLNELMAITQTKSILIKRSEENEQKDLLSYKNEQNMLDKSENSEKKIILPSLPKSKRRKWIKKKEAISRFFDKLDYNNQIQSSLDLTLLEHQQTHEHKDIA
tara:strand:+ start:2418 stop:2741 length:324 start_codon:yes stop_codon:yes gene_type:complete